jgi:hypothetical protein
MVRPLGTSEQKRLGLQEGDWNLSVGTCTRPRNRSGGLSTRNGTSDRTINHEESVGVVVSTNDRTEEDVSTLSVSVASSGSEEEEQGVEKGNDDESGVQIKKPPHTRVILELDHIQKAFDKLGCPQCGEAIKVNLRTVCIASSLGFECTNEACGYLYNAVSPAATTIHVNVARNDNFEQNTDYTINVLYILGFLSMGDGCTEAARLLGLLGFPNDTTMEGRFFTIIEDRVGPFLCKVCDEIVLANLIEEVKLSMEELFSGLKSRDDLFFSSTESTYNSTQQHEFLKDQFYRLQASAPLSPLLEPPLHLDRSLG